MIVSPLLALMKEQSISYSSKGISAACVSFIDDCQADKEKRRAIKKGEFQLVFISPEALFATLEWRRMLCTQFYRSNLVGFIVDKAHCIQKWYVSGCGNLQILILIIPVFTGAKAFVKRFLT